MIGKSFAHYEIVGLLGRGGMGEVYRARDGKLDREVALKILPEVFGRDPERVARFQREARTLASLNHANIAAIYGFEQIEDTQFLVMELVEGVDLSQRLSSGPIPLDEALEIARQIADGLEEAHEQGVVHRDLKPANVKLTPEGKVKILDFGLARAFQGETVDEGELHNSPTITAAMTQAGVILGTAAYMSPEQARGKVVDRRADLWSFGVILFEMLIGRRLFEGEDVSDTLAAVLRSEPEWDALPAATPLAVRRLLERCLERDPRQRLRDIGEARVRLEQWTSDPSTMMEAVDFPGAEPESRLRTRLPWGLALAALLIAAWGWWRSPDALPATTSMPALELELRLPGEDSIPSFNGANIQLSPDGSTIAYLNADGIMLRRLDQREVRLLSHTEGATAFTYSPDGRWIAFGAGGRLFRVSATGGAPIDVCEAPDPRGIAWVNETTIVMSPHYTLPLFKVSLDNGKVEPLTELDPSADERTHRWPIALPDGQSILYMCQYTQQQYDEGEIRHLSLVDGVSTAIYRGASFPQYSRSGHLLFVRDNSVFAIAFDPEQRATQGIAVPVLTGVQTAVNDQDADDGSAQFYLSPSGTAIYRTALSLSASARRVVELDLESGQERVLTEAGPYLQRVISPDGTKLALSRGSDDRDIYLLDLASGVESRFTFTQGADQLGCFSADSRTLYWVRTTGTGFDEVLSRAVDGSTPERKLLSVRGNMAPTGATPDGKFLAMDVWADADQWDIHLLPLDAESAEPVPIVTGPAQEIWMSFSGDGKWFSYYSDETGSFQLYVGSFPDSGARWIIESEVGFVDRMVWGADGSHIYVRDQEGTIRIPYTTNGGTFVAGRIERLQNESYLVGGFEVQVSFEPTGRRSYFLATDGSLQSDTDRRSIVLLTNWASGLERLSSSQP